MDNCLKGLFVVVCNFAVVVYFLILIGCSLWNHRAPSTTSILIGIIGFLLAYIFTTKFFS
jgi:hypothetical protein